MSHPILALASTSPRRIELMKQAGLNPRVIPPCVREILSLGETPTAFVKRMAFEKAYSTLVSTKNLLHAVIVIGADTVVVEPISRKILGKPKNLTEAKKMLSLLSGKTHLVLTAYCILSAHDGHDGKIDRNWRRIVRSKVQMRYLTPKQISHYVFSGESMDKAGAYAAQGLGMALIEKIYGSYSNVMGLPLCQLLQDLEEKFNFPIFSKKTC